MNTTKVGLILVLAAGSTLTMADTGSTGGQVGTTPIATAPAQQEELDKLPVQLKLNGVVRDFAERSAANGHPDFELNPNGGFGLYARLVQDNLDQDMKPVFRSQGQKVTSPARDAQGHTMIDSRSYIQPLRGDVPATIVAGTGGAVTNAQSFSKWFRDMPGTNASKPLAITLKRQADSNVYVFDDKLDEAFQSRGGFFPINGELMGNSAGNDRNFHFTYELATVFTYEKGKNQIFTFIGDDDVWVFIGGKLVIDIGGIHSAVSQTISLDRLGYLEDGRSYDLRFFFAERHRTQSNFRIETTLLLRTVEPPSVSSLFD